jgi:D-alanyl-lipoteichoic acid acyltransferase DltB (MBOAT superfamily)
MLFNSIEFLVFLPVVFLFYWLLSGRLRLQNLYVTLVSYVFYGWWDWRFLLLIALTSGCSYLSGIYIERYAGDRRKQRWVSGSNVVLNLLILGCFKYFNFFADNLRILLSVFGIELDFVTLRILLPVGISFYTFQALSYTIDVYRGKLRATRDPVAFFAFISFFPQLVAGPIERAMNLLPQFAGDRRFDYGSAVDGLRQVLWGFFKKVVIADNCAIFVNGIFSVHESASGSTLLLGGFMFMMQVYGDFSGYSDIAIGTSRLFGINLMRNFHYPYFARDIGEFWRRWHISLTTWFRDYLYIPLGGSRGGMYMKLRNTLILFLVSGLWHGASWTYVIWGLFHALLLFPLMIRGTNRLHCDTVAEGRSLPSIKEVCQMTWTFFIGTIACIIFRSPSVVFAWEYISGIFSLSLFSVPELLGRWNNPGLLLTTILFIVILFIVEWRHRMDAHGMVLHVGSRVIRYVIYVSLLMVILLFRALAPATFVYFQF